MEFDKQNLDTFARFESPDSLPSDTFRSTTGPELTYIQDFADALPQPMWLQTRDEIEYFNTAMQDYLGIDLNEYGREYWQQFIHPDDLSNFISEWHTALNKRQNAELQCRIQKLDHGYRMCLLNMKFHYETGSLLHWAITLTDVHDYFEIQQQLSQIIATQQNMLDASLDCIKIMTPDGKLSQCKPFWPTGFGTVRNRTAFWYVLAESAACRGLSIWQACAKACCPRYECPFFRH